jgi:hypothetical protein
MIGKMLEMWRDGWLNEPDVATPPPPHNVVPFSDPTAERQEEPKLAAAEHVVRERLEAALIQYGDDGLLERLA